MIIKIADEEWTNLSHKTKLQRQAHRNLYMWSRKSWKPNGTGRDERGESNTAETFSYYRKKGRDTSSTKLAED